MRVKFTHAIVSLSKATAELPQIVELADAARAIEAISSGS
jgi:hypothetical protein